MTFQHVSPEKVPSLLCEGRRGKSRASLISCQIGWMAWPNSIKRRILEWVNYPQVFHGHQPCPNGFLQYNPYSIGTFDLLEFANQIVHAASAHDKK